MFDLPQNSFYVMALVVGLLVLASAACFIIGFKNPEKDYTELRQRINSWWVMIALLFVVLTVSKNTVSYTHLTLPTIYSV